MSKNTADNIRAYLISQGISVPSQNGKLFDELQAHNLIEKN
ncbi:TraI domain-containing protein [[Haemophilus] ducreyi]|nr:TraI domain-containing protein [[Haemophilus] ducreyi]